MSELSVTRAGVYIRAFNQSAIDDAAVQPLDSVNPPSLSVSQAGSAPTTKQIGSIPAAGSGPKAAHKEEEDIVSANTEPLQPLITDAPVLSSLQAPLPITTKQIGSVPAVGSGSGAAKIDEEDIVSANTEPPQPLITDAPALSSLQAPLPITTKQIGSVPAAGSGSGAAEIDEEDIVSANTEPPQPLITDAPALSSLQASLPITTKQIGSVPAVGSGSGAAKIDEEDIVSANTEPPEPLTTVLPLSVAREVDDSNANASKQIGVVPAVGSGPGAATIPAAEVASANTQPPERFSATTNVSLATSLPSFNRRSKVSSDILASRSSSSLPAAPRITNTPVAANTNVAMAQTFNQFFDSMNADSTCNPGIETQRVVCIDKKTAVCGADGKYKLSACSQGEICRAVPLDQSQTGIAIKCVPEADTSPSSSSESAANSKTVASAVSPSSSLESRPPKVIITTQTIVVTPVPKTTVSAKPTLTRSVVSGVLSVLASLEKSLQTATAPKPTPTRSVVSGMLSFLASLEKGLATPTNFVTVATPSTASVVPAPPEPPQETPAPAPPSPTTSEQPAIVIEPQSRKGAEPTACPESKLDSLIGGGADDDCLVIHG